ncbi:hypothetical protein HZA57_04400 [Candidatus Poribacteria bacterium]|nr:hypothetical protein [Candidatus Poribacteria bacterium]
MRHLNLRVLGALVLLPAFSAPASRAFGQTPPPPAAEGPVPAPTLSVQLKVNGQIPGAGDLAMLIPADQTVTMTATAASGLPDKPGTGGKTASLVQERQERFQWEFNSGYGHPGSPGTLRWQPGLDGNLARVTVTVLMKSSVLADDPEAVQGWESGEASVLLLPGVPFDRTGDGMIAGAMIGIYPNEKDDTAPGSVQRNPARYTPPSSFHRIEGETAQFRVSPHATLGTLCPTVFEEPGPRFVALSPELPVFWEALYTEAAKARYKPEGLVVLRGFVSPQDRLRLEREDVKLAPFTRYQYGDALALLLDADGDGRMDDLNRDGKVDIEDAQTLADIAEDAMRSVDLEGGQGICASFEGPAHKGTPYLHVDLRGWMERWREE